MEKLNIETYSENNVIDYCGEEYVNTYTTKFVSEIRNKYLRKSRTLKAHDLYDLEYKIGMQFIDWAHMEKRLKEKEAALEKIKNKIQYVEDKNKEYRYAFENIENILQYTLNINDAVNWDSLKTKEKFTKEKPSLLFSKKLAEWDEEHPLLLKNLPEEPIKELYKPKFSFVDKIVPSRKKQKEENSKRVYEEDFKIWKEEYEATLRYNEQRKEKYTLLREEAIQAFKKADENALKEWELEKVEFYKERDLQHQRIDDFYRNYQNKEKYAVENYCEMVLNNSQYPDFISKDFEVEYISNSNILIIEYQLPSITLFPTVKECKYIATKDEIRTINISTTELNRIYDKALYDITLRTIHELIEADTINAIDAVSFNGWVRQIDKATGNEINNCIISIQVQKKEFLKINLQNVDSKLCFKGLKGVSASKLYQTTPIQPIIQIQKQDKRFVEAHDVSCQLDNSTNLASMDWEDFEYLIREIFEKEFSSCGGEVRVTQASRDGGVDAIAFDPDPIRGGKIVIQAKRYTNTVGVSAVRDLYGTVMNEGATKGILVTTADYGPDAYTFVKEKPLTLLNGSNLLFLLEKHGVHARIDIKEARQFNK